MNLAWQAIYKDSYEVDRSGVSTSGSLTQVPDYVNVYHKLWKGPPCYSWESIHYFDYGFNSKLLHSHYQRVNQIERIGINQKAPNRFHHEWKLDQQLLGYLSEGNNIGFCLA